MAVTEKKESVIYLINNDLEMINQAIEELENDLEEMVLEAVEQGLPLAAATGILHRIALSINIETED